VSHRWADPFSHIGTVTKAVETTDGLLVTGQIDDLGENDPTADQVYRLLKGRRVTQFSFAYDVVSRKPGCATTPNAGAGTGSCAS
jgi:HK97 family phage prohead protease